MLNKNKNFFGVQRPDRDVNPSGEGFEPPCAEHRRYPVLRFRGVRLGPSLAIPTCKVRISSIKSNQ